VEVGIGARPTDSENLYIQQTGRILRPYKICKKCGTEYGGDPTCYRCGSSETSYEKKEAILLDHGNNTTRFGMPYDIRHAELEPLDIKINQNRTKSGIRTCPLCFGVMEAFFKTCYSCGYDFALSATQNQENQIIVQAGELTEVDAESVKLKKLQKLKERYN
jgi:superfamily II DNA or RNA helicase